MTVIEAPSHLTHVDKLNPLRMLRKYLEFTQIDVAEAINTSEQYVRRLEQGMVSAPKGALAHYVWRQLEYRNVPAHELQRFCVESLTQLQLRTTKAYTGITTFHSSHEFEHFVGDWWEFWLLVKRETINEKPVPRTIYEFCRRLALHPYVVQRYVLVKKDNAKLGEQTIVPLSIMQAVAQTKNRDYWLGVLDGLR